MVFAGLMLALTLAALDQNIVGTALPLIVGELGGLTHLSWVVTAFMLASTATTPLYGKLSDQFGRRPLFVVSIAVFLAGSMLCGLAQSMTQLILFRGLQGLGAGGLMTLAQTTIADIIPPRERGKYQGLFGAVFAGCSVAGPLLGGVITDMLNWRWIFYVNVPVGAAALVMILLGLKRRPLKGKPRIDFGGAFLLSASTACLLLVLSWGGTEYPWGSTMILALAAAAVVLTAALIWQERRAPEPILPPRLFGVRTFQIAVPVIGLNATALFGALVFMPLFFQLVLNQTPSRSGLLMAPLMGGVITSSIISGRLVSRFGRYKFMTMAGLTVATLSFVFLYWSASTAQSLGYVEAGLVCMGLSLGLVMPNLTVAIQNDVEPQDLGTATSASAFFRSLGGSLGVAISGALLNHGLADRLNAAGMSLEEAKKLMSTSAKQLAAIPAPEHQVLVDAYRQAIAHNFLTGAGIAALALLLVCFLPERPLRGAEPVREGPGLTVSPE